MLRESKEIEVRVGSRKLDRAEALAASLREETGRGASPFATADEEETARGIAGADLVVAAGAAGVTLLPAKLWKSSGIKVLIDLNAVPPTGVEGVEPTDKKKEREAVLCWGALGVGGLKMKIHKKALAELFNANGHVFDAEECLVLGRALA